MTLQEKGLDIAIFTKEAHIEKLGSSLSETGLIYFISTRLQDAEGRSFPVGVSYCFPRHEMV